uniref:protein-serine/threonine phosphatase n=1 Tax=Mesocestoides corti TaxID=53468 RepID=A0A5K3FAL9_MESCO
MGQLISGPVTLKDTKLWQNSQFSVAASSMQGWRVRMEDSYACFLNLSSNGSPFPPTAYFAVFDGHGGTKVSEYAANNLHTKITSQPAYAQGDIAEAMRLGILKLDAEMQTIFTGSVHPQSAAKKTAFNSSGLEEGKLLAPTGPAMDVGGSTCIALMLRGNRAYCANCGDSRAVLSRLGVAEALSVDHKPTIASEWNRILAAGGWVAANRVNGNLALSRALGDFTYKRNALLSPEEQIVSAEPDVTHCELKTTESDEFIVIGCDGIWDVMTNQEVVSYVRSRLASGYPPDSVS